MRLLCRGRTGGQGKQTDSPLKAALGISAAFYVKNTGPLEVVDSARE
ncbi:MAG: hypothetical protein J2P46_11155 [Zavarzinella sp.]|nr:hypothetical protein [Zavarzinella sp.]